MTAAAAEPVPGEHQPDCCCRETSEIAEGFEVYRSGAALTLLCLHCKASRAIVGKIVLQSLIDEAAAHADTCPGPPESEA